MLKPSADLAPGFLIASPPLGDPNFDRTVVLLVLHGEQGALGFVVNRLAPMTFAEFLSHAGYGVVEKAGSTRVLLGGPVEPTSGWILALDSALDTNDASVLPVGDRVRISRSRDALDRLVREAADRSPSAVAHESVLLGYSGWGPGQLENEISAGAWLPVPLDEAILFDVAIDDRWERAYALLGLTPALMMTMRGGGEA